MTWKQVTERDCREWKLSAIDPHDRDTWRSGVRSAMHAASQSLYLHVNEKSDDDDDEVSGNVSGAILYVDKSCY